MTTREALLRTVDDLTEEQQRALLAHACLLKLGLSGRIVTEEEMDAALSDIRQIAAERGVSEEDIAAEIRSARSSR